jgi:NAD(P)H-dependent flavin oxidoreductase YrpB (nitropropane dioxygenase family)
MLADVDYVIMGAGIPKEIPGALDLMSENKEAALKVPVDGGDDVLTRFNPQDVMESENLKQLKRPYFFPIVSSATLALNLKRKSTGRVDGFIVEGPLAGGHNAPPRGQMKLNERGEPIYGERDVVDLAEMKALELPFWMAGHYATPEKLADVRAQGAHGIQVGT